MAGRDGETDSEGSAALHVPAVVRVCGRRVHRQHQHHRYQQLDTQPLNTQHDVNHDQIFQRGV